MLRFLRTHQKFFFIVTTAAVVVTFCFFGTYSTIEKVQKRKDHKIALALNGKPLMQSEIEALSYLLTLDANSHLLERSGLLLKGDLVRKNFFQNKLAHLLVQSYFDQLKPSFDQVMQKVYKYKLYEHPDTNAVSQAKVYEQFYPEMLSSLQTLKKTDNFSEKTFDLLVQLYNMQETFSPYALKRLLVFQQSQYPEVPLDPAIYQNDMSLFGFREFSDWFTKDFTDLLSQFVLNTASLAEEKGFSVSAKEVKMNLNAYLQAETDQPSADLPLDFYKSQLRLMGMEEKTLLAAWQKLMLFHKYMQATASSMIVDPLLIKEMSDFTQEKVTVAVYSLPEVLNLKSLEELAALKVYLKAIYGKEDLEPSLVIRPLQEIEENFPELVVNFFAVELKGCDIQDLTLKIGEKQLWQWQMQSNNFALLQKQFPELSGEYKIAEEIFHKLESLAANVRSKVDDYARQLMVKSDDQLIKKALFAAQKEDLTLELPSKGGKTVLKGVSNQKLLSLLKAALNGDLKAQEELSFLTEDSRYYYSIAAKTQPIKNCFHFVKALSESSLLELSENLLFKKHGGKKMVKQDQQENKTALLQMLYLAPKEKEETFLQNFKKAYLANVKNLMQAKDDALYFSADDSLENQFKLKKEIKTISRSSEDSWLKSQLLSAEKIAAYSEVDEAHMSFFAFVKKEKENNLESINNLKNILEKEAVLKAAENLIQQIKTKKALSLPVKRAAANES